MTEVLDTQLEGKDLIRKGISELNDKNYEGAKYRFLEAQKKFTAMKSPEYISVCMSLAAITTYLLDKNSYKKVLETINDAVYMAQYSKSNTAKLIAEMVLGNINFDEKNNDVALLHYNNAKEFAQENDEFLMLDYINARINQLQSGMEFSLPMKSDPLVSLVKIGRSITALTDINVLLKVIAEETKMQFRLTDARFFFLIKKKMNSGQRWLSGWKVRKFGFLRIKGLRVMSFRPARV